MKTLKQQIDDLEATFSEELNKLRKLLKSNLDGKIVKKDIFTITKYSDVCIELGEKEETCPYKKIKQIEKFYNQEWKPNWSNTNEYKYYPYFSLSSAGGLVYYGFVNCYGDFFGGVAFYKDSKTAKYVGETYTKEYEDLKK